MEMINSPKRAKKNGYRVIDLFSGSGGLSLGFRQAGFSIALGVDIDKTFINTFKINFPEAVIANMDVKLLNKELVYKMMNLEKDEEIDVVVMGPSCQGFSQQNKQRDDEENRDENKGGCRNDLIIETAFLVAELRPKVFLLENVPTLSTSRGQYYLDQFNEILKEYESTGSVVNAAEYGVPQTRQRYILVGRRKDLDITFLLPEKTHPLPEQYRTVRDAISDLPEPPKDYSCHPKYNNHAKPRISPLNEERLKHIPPNGSWRDLPEKLKHKCHKKMNGRTSGGWTDVLGRLSWDKPSPTITSGCQSITKGRYAFPTKPRGITLREAARLQTYPDSFVFEGSRENVATMIGNSVPPMLAKHFAESIKQSLDSIQE
jgi:DNA (cytosine-5)-methyltransferase 1